MRYFGLNYDKMEPINLLVMRRQILGKMLLVAVVLSQFFFLRLFTPSALAFNDGDAAVNVLGQLDADGQVSFTSLNLRKNAFNYLSGIAVDTVGHRLFTAESENNRVLVFNLNSSNEMIDYDADYVLGQATFDTNTSGVTATSLYGPAGLAYSANMLYVADSYNSRIMVFDVTAITNGEAAVNVLGQADFVTDTSGTTATTLSGPESMTIGGSQLYVSDRSNNRIMVFDVTSITDGEAAVNVLGQTDFVTSTSGASATSLKIRSAYGVAYGSNKLYVADWLRNRVMVFDVTSITDGEAAVNVLGQPDFVTKTAATSAIKMSGPRAVAVSGTTLYVGDAGNNRILSFDVTAISDGEAAVNVLGQPDFVTATDYAGAPTQATASTTVEMALTSNLLYAATVNRVTVFDVTAITDNENAVNALGEFDDAGAVSYTKPINTANGVPNKQSADAAGMALDTTGHRLFVADSATNRVLVFNLNASNELVDYSADHVLGQATFIAAGYGTTSTTLSFPRGLAFDSNILYVTDQTNNRVMVFDVTAITDGEAAVHVLGQPDFTSATISATDSIMYGPSDVEVTGSTLYVADYFNSRVLVFDVTAITDGEAAVHVLGQLDFVSNIGNTTQSTLSFPVGLAYGSNKLYVTDTNNSRVMVFDVTAITDGEAAVHVLGQLDFISMGTGTTQSTLAYPVGISLVGNILYVADAQNYRVLSFDVASITDGENAAHVLGQADFTSAASGLAQTTFSNPVYVEATASFIYVSDTTDNRVMIFSVGSANTPPTVTTPVIVDHAGSYTVYVDVDDADLDNTLQLYVEYSLDGGSVYSKATISESLVDITATTGTPDVENDNARQIGNAGGYILGSSGVNSISFVWTSLIDEPVASTSNAMIRVTPYDGTDEGTAVASATFSVSNGASSGGGGTAIPKILTFSVMPSDFTWTTTSTVRFVDLAYSLNDGATYTDVVSSTDNDGAFAWLLPETLYGKTVLYRIQGLSYAGLVVAQETAVETFSSSVPGVEVPPQDTGSVKPGDYIKGVSFTTVYYVDEEMHRRPFLNEQIYFTWQDDFSRIKTIDDAELPALALAAPILPKPGVKLVKIEDNARVYEVVRNEADFYKPILVWIQSEDEAAQKFGTLWAKQVLDIPVTFYNRFEIR